MLSKAFKEYLTDRQAAAKQGAVIGYLEANNYLTETMLLKRYFGQGAGWIEEKQTLLPDRAWVGEHPPADGKPWEFWLDTCELTLSILVPRPQDEIMGLQPELVQRITPHIGWLGLNPVANWQFEAFLQLAQFEPNDTVDGSSVDVLRRERIVSLKEEYAPVSNLTADEASLYALWFGKTLSSLEYWQAAAPKLAGSVWSLPAPDLHGEWLDDGYSISEDLRMMVTKDTIDNDPFDEYDLYLDGIAIAENERTLFSRWSLFEHVGFRTAVSSQIGLISEDSSENSTAKGPIGGRRRFELLERLAIN